MPITIKQIAEIAGVSRGTVDRVLNNRTGVSREVHDRVTEIAKQHGYTPNKAGKVLAINKKPIYIGVAVNSVGNPFFDEVINGMESAYSELCGFGLKLKILRQKGYDPQKQINHLQRLIKDGVNAVIFTPINHRQVIDYINSVDIPMATINQDIEGAKRLFYIGCDYEAGGRTAGQIMGLVTHGDVKVGIVTGSVKVLGHNKRIHGFSRVIKERFFNISIVEIVENNDDDEVSYNVTRQMLSEKPEINALFFAAAGINGAVKAVTEMGFKGRIICFDDTEDVKAYVKSGLISATICQEPYKQGYLGIKTMYEFASGLGGDGGLSRYIYTDTQIKIKENI